MIVIKQTSTSWKDHVANLYYIADIDKNSCSRKDYGRDGTDRGITYTSDGAWSVAAFFESFDEFNSFIYDERGIE